MRVRGCRSALLVLPLLASCAADASTVTWEVRFSDAALADEAVRIETFVRPGGCDAAGLVYRAELRPDVPAPPPPELGPGRYGFAAMARDGECRTIARGCAEADLPAGGEVAVVLQRVSEPAACASSVCTEGLCGDEDPPPDGGAVPLPDAGDPDPDADVPGEDGGVPADGSGQPPDAGDPDPPCQMRGDSCYLHRAAALSWGAAESSCIAWGGHLVSIADGDEQDWLIATFGPALDVWIGLSDRDVEGEFVWTDGGDASFRAWAGSAPDNRGSGEDCVHLDTSVLGWDDRKCQQTRGYVCER